MKHILLFADVSTGFLARRAQHGVAASPVAETRLVAVGHADFDRVGLEAWTSRFRLKGFKP